MVLANSAADPANQGMADTLDDAIAAFKKRYLQLRERLPGEGR